MAFAEASNFTINHSTFIDNSSTTTPSNVKTPYGQGLQILLNAISSDASFDSQARHPPPRCHPSTRTGLLDHIFQWMDTGEEDILFLDGPAGTGKTSIAQTLAVRCAERQLLLASYFFFRGSPSRNTIAPLIPTIAYYIATSSPQMRKKMKKLIEEDPSILNKSTDVQLRKLILELYQPSLFRWKLSSKRKRSLLIIDGLDECIGDNDQRQVVNLLGQLAKSKHFPVRCFITSRPEPHIISAIESLVVKVARVTLNDQTWDATRDIRTYFRSSFDEISSRLPSSVPRPWPSDAILETLIRKAGGVFVYASTVIKYIDDQDSSPTLQLEHVLELSPGTTPFAELDQLYRQILAACPSQHRVNLLHIFGFVLLRNPAYEEAYNVALIEAILGLSHGKVAIVLRRMHSILAITTSGTKKLLGFLHASFGDFLFNRERSGQFFIDRRKENLFLATKCVDYMSHREQRGLDNISLGNKAILYAWNSWQYHGMHASDSCFLDFVTKLRHCDKSSWIKSFPEDYHHLCVDGLGAGIAWLQDRSSEDHVSVVISDLELAKEELEWSFCANILVNVKLPIIMLRVFEDPGIDFFNSALDDDFLVVLDPGDKPLTALYFRCRGKAYDLAERGAGLTSNVFRRPQNKHSKFQHGFIALHCIRRLKDTNYRSDIGLRYAAKYWAKHISLTNAIDDDVLEELRWVGFRETTPERKVNFADATLVIRWLENMPQLRHKAALLPLWKGHRLQLGSGSSLGFSGERRLPRELLLPGIVHSKSADASLG